MVEPTGPDAPSEMHAGPLHHRLRRDDLRDLARGWAHSSGLHSPPARGWARTSRLDKHGLGAVCSISCCEREAATSAANRRERESLSRPRCQAVYPSTVSSSRSSASPGSSPAARRARL